MSFLFSAIRKLVSKKKKRYTGDNVDLDLTYITDNIIAMGFPSEGKEALYRNPMEQVIALLEKKHKDHYKVYNLCSERLYDHVKFKGNVEVFPFPDHNPPPLALIRPFCTNVDNWLKQDPANVAVIHCKAGKGRTGTMISAYLLHKGNYDDAEKAMEFFGLKRTHDGKGVTISSQRRYVHYYAQCLKNGFPKSDRKIAITKISLSPVPGFSNGFTPLVSISILQDEVYHNLREMKLQTYSQLSASADIVLNRKVMVRSDVKIEFFNYDKKNTKKKKKMFRFWFNTNMVDISSGTLEIQRMDLDGKPKKDKKHEVYAENFKVTVHFEDLAGLTSEGSFYNLEAYLKKNQFKSSSDVNSEGQSSITSSAINTPVSNASPVVGKLSDTLFTTTPTSPDARSLVPKLNMVLDNSENIPLDQRRRSRSHIIIPLNDLLDADVQSTGSEPASAVAKRKSGHLRRVLSKREKSTSDSKDISSDASFTPMTPRNIETETDDDNESYEDDDEEEEEIEEEEQGETQPAK